MRRNGRSKGNEGRGSRRIGGVGKVKVSEERGSRVSER